MNTPIIVALDCPSTTAAWQLLEQLDPTRCRVKIGKELFTRAGPQFVAEVVKRDFQVFLDLKFHDIPNTVAGACAAAADLGVWMLNVHAAGGLNMMQTAAERLAQCTAPPLLIAVTVLTSLSGEDLAQIGCPGTAAERVVQLAKLSQQAGLDGVVCSAQEAAVLRATLNPSATLVTPGIRPTPTTDDQQRVATPAAALQAGADYLVIGRPITAAPDPLAALAAIEAEIAIHS